MGYCRVLLRTAGYCRVLLGTTGYWGYWAHTGGRRGYCGGTTVYWVVLGAVGGTGGTWGTNRHCGVTAECWGGGVLEVLGSNRGYWGIHWSTLGYCRVLLGVGGTNG